MNRRGFLGALAGATAALSLAPISALVKLSVPPKVWGDGIHDDTAAIQWHVDRGIAIPRGESGRYLITDTIVVRPDGRSRLVTANSTWRGHLVLGKPMISIKPDARYSIHNNTFDLTA